MNKCRLQSNAKTKSKSTKKQQPNIVRLTYVNNRQLHNIEYE